MLFLCIFLQPKTLDKKISEKRPKSIMFTVQPKHLGQIALSIKDTQGIP